MKPWQRLMSAVCLPMVFATACASEAPTDEGDATSDELNYRSTAGQEFSLSTDVVFALSADVAALEGDARDAAILEQAEGLRGQVTQAISAELDRIWPEEERLSSAGVAIQFRQASATLADLQVRADGRYGMKVSAEFAGIKNLEQRLPLSGEGASKFLPLPIDLGAGTETLKVSIARVERSLNAYPKYLDLFADGLDISVHFGGDHNTPPMDIEHARSVYDDLRRSGFRSPVATFADLKIDSGPLESTIVVRGERVAVRVHLYHVDMSTPDTRDLLVDAYKAAMKDSDVVIYDGHAGRSLGYSGVVFAYNPARSSLPANAWKDVEVGDKQQVYLFNGCETYTGYADKVYENPARNVDNTDIITTGNYSAIQRGANQVISFIHSFIDQKSGAWIPRSWDSVLDKMNKVGERSWVHVYGVHGIDDDPKVSPLADVSKLGTTCTQDSQCGAADSRCIRAGSRRVCGIACADDVGCPSGTKCVLPPGRTSADDQQCAPAQ